MLPNFHLARALLRCPQADSSRWYNMAAPAKYECQSHHDPQQRADYHIAGVVITVVDCAHAHQQNGEQQPRCEARQKSVDEHQDDERQHDVRAGERVPVHAGVVLNKPHQALEQTFLPASELLHSEIVCRAARREEQIGCVTN